MGDLSVCALVIGSVKLNFHAIDMKPLEKLHIGCPFPWPDPAGTIFALLGDHCEPTVFANRLYGVGGSIVEVDLVFQVTFDPGIQIVQICPVIQQPPEVDLAYIQIQAHDMDIMGEEQICPGFFFPGSAGQGLFDGGSLFEVFPQLGQVACIMLIAQTQGIALFCFAVNVK